MAILKYTNQDGQLVSVNSYKINNVIVSQEKGQSTTDVMSQKAVTDEINEINNILGDVASNDDLGELQNIVNLKANKADVYMKTEVDNAINNIDLSQYETIENAQATYQTKLSVGSNIRINSANAISAIVPTEISELNNDAGYLTEHQSLEDYYTKDEMDRALEDVNLVINTKASNQKVNEINASISTLSEKFKVIAEPEMWCSNTFYQNAELWDNDINILISDVDFNGKCLYIEARYFSNEIKRIDQIGLPIGYKDGTGTITKITLCGYDMRSPMTNSIELDVNIPVNETTKSILVSLPSELVLSTAEFETDNWFTDFAVKVEADCELGLYGSDNLTNEVYYYIGDGTFKGTFGMNPTFVASNLLLFIAGSVGTKEIGFSDYYTKEEVDTVISNVSVDLSDYYTKEEVDAKSPVIWCGTQEEYDALPIKNNTTIYYIK